MLCMEPIKNLPFPTNNSIYQYFDTIWAPLSNAHISPSDLGIKRKHLYRMLNIKCNYPGFNEFIVICRYHIQPTHWAEWMSYQIPIMHWFVFKLFLAGSRLFLALGNSPTGCIIFSKNNLPVYTEQKQSNTCQTANGLTAAFTWTLLAVLRRR